MPIYEYRCSACGFEREALQKMSDAPLVDCPQCGKPSLVKLISAAGFHLKGSGWYATDFKGSGSSKPAGKGGTDAGGTDAGATAGKGESGADGAKSAETPAAKAEPAAAKPTTTPGSGD